jgi:hypothetical protein
MCPSVWISVITQMVAPILLILCWRNSVKVQVNFNLWPKSGTNNGLFASIYNLVFRL